MTEKTRRFFSAASLEAAVMEAARYFGVDPERLAYDRHAKRHGFLRGRRSVVIEVDPAAPAQEAVPAAGDRSASAGQSSPVGRPATTAAAEVGSPVAGSAQQGADAVPEPGSAGLEPAGRSDEPRRAPADGALEAAVRDALGRVFELVRLDLEVEVFQADDELEVELSGRDEARLLEDRGALIVAIQHLLPRLVRGATGRPAPCRVDAGGFHAARRERLLGLAERSAADVRRSGKPWVFDPMSPDERRIIHLALADQPDVETESQGRGFFKRLTVRPVRDSARGAERYNR